MGKNNKKWILIDNWVLRNCKSRPVVTIYYIDSYNRLIYRDKVLILLCFYLYLWLHI
jgi:hypothetical protein